MVIYTPGSAAICSLALQGVGICLVLSVPAYGYAERAVIFKTAEPAPGMSNEAIVSAASGFMPGYSRKIDLPEAIGSVNSRQIETFVAVMKAGTISRAAELLGVTQPGVSRTIAGLETSVGFLLFDRVCNRIVPTPEGRLVYDEVVAAFRGMDKIRSAAARIRDHGAGQIRVGSLLALGSSLVRKAVRRFREKRPDTAATLMVLPCRGVRNGVAAGVRSRPRS